MKQKSLLKTMLLLFALIAGSSSVWAGDVTATLTGSNMLEGNSPSTSYAEHLTTGITDDKGFKYYGRWTYQKDGSNYMNMIQLKKLESSNSTRIQLPTFDGPIKSITITATNTSATASNGTGASTTLIIVKGTTYTTSFATTAANQVLTAGSSSTATNTYSFDFTSLSTSYDGTGLYICTKDAGIRIWSIVVVYSEADYYNVTYKYNDGVTADKVVQVAKGDAASYTLDAAPSRTDFSFQGWNDGTNTYNGGAAYPVTKAVTFTAQWSFTGTPTVYNRSNKNDIATGAKYIMAGVKDDVWGYASGISGSNTYIDASSFEPYSTVSASTASLTSESPLVITLEETADGWYLKDATGKKLGLNGDKKVAWDKGDMTWTLGGTADVPTFTATNSSSDYILKYNAGAVRFTGYTSGQQDVYFYRLDDGNNVYTLTLDVNDGETAATTHRVLQSATFTLPIPTRAGYHFAGWNTVEGGTGTNYPAGGYTMPAAATTLYAQWETSQTVTIAASGYSTLATTCGLDFANTTPAGLEAYVASAVSASAVTLTQVTEAPASTGVILKGDASTVYTIPVKADAAAVGTNYLHAAVTATACAANEVYILQSGQFHLVNAASTVPAGKAYLLASDVPASAPDFLGFSFDGTTGIESVETPKNVMNGEFYNLAGQRVANPTKGLYIVNGKKVIVK